MPATMASGPSSPGTWGKERLAGRGWRRVGGLPWGPVVEQMPVSFHLSPEGSEGSGPSSQTLHLG